MNRAERSTLWSVAAWALAVAGYWAPWLPEKAAALRLNGFELAEWVTFLPEVRDGSASVGRLTFYVPLACLAIIAALLGGRMRRWWAMVPLAMIGLAFGLAMLPPYPFILDILDDPELKAQGAIGIATGGLVALGLWLGSRTVRGSAGLALGLGLAGIAYSVQAVVGVSGPYARLLGRPLSPTWAWGLLWAGLGALALGEGRLLLEHWRANRRAKA